MKRILWGMLLLAPLGACTYVNEQPGYAQGGYQGGYAQPQYAPGYGQQGYVQQQAPVAIPGYRDGSYEAERQAYEYGRRDGAGRGQVFR